MRSFATGPLLLLAVGLLLSAGCSSGGRPPLGTVSGRVTLDGQPLAGAMVAFHPEQGQVSRALTDAEGRYELIYLRDIKGALVGTHKVVITTATEHEPRERLPACYHRETKLVVEVEDGRNTHDFALRSDGSGA